MATGAELLVDGFGRIRGVVEDTLDSLSPDELAARIGAADHPANSIGWLVWHLTRVQDDHIADAAGTDQVWTSEGWYERFGLPFAPAATGYGHSSADVAAVRGLTAEQLAGYHRAVHDRTVQYVGKLGEDELDRVVDENWTPPVTLAVRLVSVIGDDLQHAGQAAFVRGVLRAG